MKFTFETGNQKLTVILFAVFAISVIGIASGFNSGDPEFVGHNVDEIDARPFVTGTYTFPSGSTLKLSGDKSFKSSGTGSVFVHWGSPDPPPGEGLTEIYDGLGFSRGNFIGTGKTYGGGASIHCITEPDMPPEISISTKSDRIFPLHTRDDDRINFFPSGITKNTLIQCSVVYSERNHMIVFGTNVCPGDWESAYKGYSMSSGKSSGNGNLERICVSTDYFDSSRPSSTTDHRAEMVPTRITQQNDVSDLYVDNTYVKCVVCLDDAQIM